jgi:hypothetical protein
MGLFLCDICNQNLSCCFKADGNYEKHVCKNEDILAYIDNLRNIAGKAERNLDEIRNAVFMTIQDLPSLTPEEITIKTKWIKQVWDAANCKWYENPYNHGGPDYFLGRWCSMHRLLCEAYDLFRSKKGESLLTKLTNLREAVDNSKVALGYQDSKLDMKPEDLLK